MRIHLATAVAISAVLGSHSVVWAQGQMRNLSSSGVFGSTRTLGGGVSAGSRSFGSGSMNIAGSGDPFTGSTGAGLTGSERFLRGNQQAGSFVGRSADQSFIGAASDSTGTGGRMGEQIRSLLGLGGNNRGGNTGRGGAAGRGSNVEIRTSLRVGFDYQPKVATRVGTRLAEQLARTSRIRSRSGVQVQVQDGTATLRGVVATVHDRDLIEQFARLEAGIWTVKNELVVAAISEEPPSLPPNAQKPASGR